jgi:hypothetical protein
LSPYIYSPPALKISVATDNELRFTAETIRYDSTYKHDSFLEIKAVFYAQPTGGYDGVYGYGGGLYSYRLSDGTLAGYSYGNTADRTNWGFYSVGPAPTPTRPLPEPETFALSLVGLTAIGIGIRRRKVAAWNSGRRSCGSPSQGGSHIPSCIGPGSAV